MPSHKNSASPKQTKKGKKRKTDEAESRKDTENWEDKNSEPENQNQESSWCPDDAKKIIPKFPKKSKLSTGSRKPDNENNLSGDPNLADIVGACETIDDNDNQDNETKDVDGENSLTNVKLASASSGQTNLVAKKNDTNEQDSADDKPIDFKYKEGVSDNKDCEEKGNQILHSEGYCEALKAQDQQETIHCEALNAQDQQEAIHCEALTAQDQQEVLHCEALKAQDQHDAIYSQDQEAVKCIQDHQETKCIQNSQEVKSVEDDAIVDKIKVTNVTEDNDQESEHLKDLSKENQDPTDTEKSRTESKVAEIMVTDDTVHGTFIADTEIEVDIEDTNIYTLENTDQGDKQLDGIAVQNSERKNDGYSAYSQESQTFEVHPDIELHEEVTTYITSTSGDCTDENKGQNETSYGQYNGCAAAIPENSNGPVNDDNSIIEVNETGTKDKMFDTMDIIADTKDTSVDIKDTTVDTNNITVDTNNTSVISCTNHPIRRNKVISNLDRQQQEAEKSDDSGTDTDDITDSQLCAMDWTVSDEFNQRKPANMSMVEPKVPSRKADKIPMMPSGTTIVKGLIHELSQLNMMILKTKREIETVRRQRNQKQQRQPAQTTFHNSSWFNR